MKLYNTIKYKYLICDSIKAYNYFRNKINYSKFLSSSPAIIFNKHIRSESVYKFWKRQSFKKFQKSINEHNKEIYYKLRLNKNISEEESIVANIAIHEFQKIIFKIACISNIKEKDTCLFISHKSSNPSFKFTQTPWDKIFGNRKNFNILEYKDNLDKPSRTCNKFSDKINIVQRIFFAGIETIIFRFFSKIIYACLFLKKKKYLICINENELLLEIASEFIKKRYKILDTSDIKKVKLDTDHKNINIIYSLCEPFVKKRLKAWTNKYHHKEALRIFKNTLTEHLNSFWEWEFTFKNFLNKNKYLNFSNTVLFCNAPSNPKCLAIKNVINKINIPLIAFQHGVSAEISNSHDYNRIFHDTTSSDIFISFNKHSSQIANKNPFSRAFTVNYRGSKRFNRVKKFIFNKTEKNSVLYLSNNLYKGYFGSLGTWTTDEGMANNEMRIINAVFKKLDKNIFYKPYPEINHRYFDMDPVITLLKKQNKIKLINNNIDARYLLGNFEIIMCGSATSTLSWALMSEKPLVFINYTNHASLKKEAYSCLKDGIFLFDFDSADFNKKIINFLNSNIDDIKHEWQLRKKTRESFINNFISEINNRTNIYKEINKKISSFQNLNAYN